MSEYASFSTPCLSLAEVEDKLEELDVYLTEVTLKLQLMKDRAELEDRTEELRHELAERSHQHPVLPPVRHDLFLIRAGVVGKSPSPDATDSWELHTSLADEGFSPGESTQKQTSQPQLLHSSPHAQRGKSHQEASDDRRRKPVCVSSTWRPRRRQSTKTRLWSTRRDRRRDARTVLATSRRGLKKGARFLQPRRSERASLSEQAVESSVSHVREVIALKKRSGPWEDNFHLRKVAENVADRGRGGWKDRPSSEEVQTQAVFGSTAWASLSEGSLVWAKLGTSKWWPGMLVRGERGGMTGAHQQPWVFWFGDHRISEVPRDRVTEFSAGFESLVQPDYANKTYQLGLVEALRECRRQLGLDPMTGSLHQVINWGRSAVTRGMTFRDVSVPAFVLSYLEKIRKSQRRDGGSASEGKPGPTEYRVPPRPDDQRAQWPRSVSLESVCLSCGSNQVVRGHPLFIGGLCSTCEQAVTDTMFALAEDNISPYCVVCCQLGQLLICDEAACSRGYCYVCLRLLIGRDAPESLTSLAVWRCPMCHATRDVTGLLRRRPDWKQQVAALFTPRTRPTPPPPADQFRDRRPIRVLSLFDGIATGMHVLTQLGVAVEVYLASETDQDAIHVAEMNHPRVTQIGPVETLTDSKICELAPMDLVLAGSPCTDLSVVNPARCGLYDPEGTGILFFDFYRVLRSVEVSNRGRHMFWLFENTASMPLEYRKVISRFLGMEPALIDAKHFTAQSRPRFFWGNIPGLYTPLPPHLLQSEHSIEPCLVLPSRRPVTEQVGCVTTSRNSLRQGKLGVTPVTMDGEGDVMWITEIEQMFGLPRHYTDLGSLGPQKRQQLLGRAWSVPVIRHILHSLTPFFATADGETERA
ncbi:DNA (cytosine-5)-methyltransferase 3C-like isoform X1 [Amphibalanus amphitrite]|nr:DNA (cytosine-5)-methyltransferase 3C-like isoform X1 [Amphibalanus amphitrite]XP_043239322.1 DNA (cytosine-5)-methyltransferase 3C-like isoform X1 [Amphibalanus amphitrite]XP_043239323.1 DNA (cytosine-5)-methyltransferase 3C-like isoform X1 [Amphibalanus amphitrite]